MELLISILMEKAKEMMMAIRLIHEQNPKILVIRKVKASLPHSKDQKAQIEHPKKKD